MGKRLGRVERCTTASHEQHESGSAAVKDMQHPQGQVLLDMPTCDHRSTNNDLEVPGMF